MEKNSNPRLEVIDESTTGLNRRFIDKMTGETLTRGQVADRINHGHYPGYHVMNRDGKRIPRSNPNKAKEDNLG